MHLNQYGLIVQKWWNEVPIHFPNVALVAFVTMPNHVHGIIFITSEHKVRAAWSPINQNQNDLSFQEERNQIPDGKTSTLHRPTLGQIMAYFKYQSTKEINRVGDIGVITKLWQRNYYEHIIRNDKELQRKTIYIVNNSSRWVHDQ